MVKLLFLLVASTAVLVNAQQIQVRVTDLTNTQAIIRYAAPDSNACTVQVFNSSGAVVNDVNEALFPGSSSDANFQSLAQGTSRVFIIGKKTSSLSSDTKFYSRALQTDSNFTGKVTCGSQSGTFIFHTKTIPLGDTSPVSYPFDSSAYGNYAWPTIDLTTTDKGYIDPQTGLLYHLMTKAGEQGEIDDQQILVWKDFSGLWVNPENMMAGGPYSSYSGAGGPGNFLFLPIQSWAGQRGFIATPKNQVDDVNLYLHGYGDSSNAADRTMNLCLTLDRGNTCAGATHQFTMPYGQTSAAVVYAMTRCSDSPASTGCFPAPPWQNWTDSRTIKADTLAVDFEGAATVDSISHHALYYDNSYARVPFKFPTSFAPGSKIMVAGTDPTCPNNLCDIDHVIDSNHLYLTQDLGTAYNGSSTTLTAAFTGTTLQVANAAVLPRQTTGWSFNIINTGHIVSATSSGAVIASSDNTPNGGYYGMKISIISGTGAGQSVHITSNDLASHTISIDNPWQTIPDSTSVYEILARVTCSALSGNTFSSCAGTSSSYPSGAVVRSTAFQFQNVGIKLWKSNSTGGIHVDNLRMLIANSSDFFTGYDGVSTACYAPNIAVAYQPDGITPMAPVNMSACLLENSWENQLLVLLDPETGSTRMLSNVPFGAQQDATNPLRFYSYNTTDHNIYVCTYNAEAGKFKDYSNTYISTSIDSSIFPCSPITAGTGNDVVSSIAAKYPNFPFSYYGFPQNSLAIYGTYAALTMWIQQNSLEYQCFFDLSKAPGSQLLYCGDSVSTYPRRWAGAHGPASVQSVDGWAWPGYSVPLESPSVAGIGMYSMPVTTVYNNAGSTAITPGFRDPQTCEQLGVSDARWIAEGATGNNCIKVNVPYEPVNTNPATADVVDPSTSSGFMRPRAWSKNSTACHGDNSTGNCWSYLQAAQEGDWVADESAGGAYGEQLVIVKKTVLADKTIDLVLARGHYQPPLYCSQAPTAHAVGWKLTMMVPFNCNGGTFWTKLTDPARTLFADTHTAWGGHGVYFIDPDTNKFTQASSEALFYGQNLGYGYGIRSGILPDVIGTDTAYGVQMWYPFHGLLRRVNIQSHPGLGSILDSQGNKQFFGFDGRPLGGASGGVPTVWQHTYSLVNGQSSTYGIDIVTSGQGQNVTSRKTHALLAWSGSHQLKDISGPGSVINDSKTWTYCYADFAGECVTGSTQGNAYVSVPNADINSKCYLGLDKNVPCIANFDASAGGFTQFDLYHSDPIGNSSRRLGSWFGGVGLTDNYANLHGSDSLPWVVSELPFTDGTRSMIMGGKVPSWLVDSVNRTDYVNIPVSLSGQAGDTVRIRFGYDTNLYCTSRQEQCTTGATNGDAFAWLSEPTNWQTCGSSGCTVSIPAFANRLVYYVVDRKRGTETISSAMQVIGIP